MLRVEIVDRLDAVVLADVGSGFGCEHGQSANPAARLQRSVRWMEDGSYEPPLRVQLTSIAPLGVEAVRDKRLILLTKLHRLLVVVRDAKAASASELVACQLLHHVELLLGALPEQLGRLPADCLRRDRVRRGGSAQGEATVAAAGPLRDGASVVYPHALARRGQRERARAAGDAGADNSDIDRSVELPHGQSRCRLVQPVGNAHGWTAYVDAVTR